MKALKLQLLLVIQMTLMPSASYSKDLINARTVIIRAATAPQAEFESWLAIHKQYIPYSKAQLQISSNSPAAKTLQRSIERAQKSYLTAPAKEAVENFIKVIGLSLQQDWNEDQRFALFHSYLRIAQLSPSSEKAWLQRAICFAPDLTPNPNMFSPEYIAKWKQVANGTPWVKVQPHDSEFSRILINGRAVAKSTVTSLCQQKYRLTWIADHLQKVTKISHPSLLKTIKVNEQAIVRGNCEWPRVEQRGELRADVKDPTVYFHPECIKKVSSVSVAQNDSNPLPNITLRPPATTGSNESNFALSKHDQPLPTTKTRVSNKKTWIWTAVAIVGTGAAIAYHNSQNRDRSKDKDSSHKDGL